MALVKAINPGKRSLSRGIKYISNPEKTEESLISGKDCDAQTALEEMKATKELYGKTEGRQYKHFVQSFNPDDPLDPSQAHQIGFEMAQKAFPGYEVLVATHTDKDHLHNHFIVNSVNFETGEKYRQSINELQEIKELSNRICEREGLHVMKKGEQTPGKSLSMNEYQVAIKGKSWKFTTMNDIDQTMDRTRSKEEFIKAMEDKGYKVKWTDERKYITYTTPDGHKVRDNKLHDSKYLKEEMESGFSRIKENQLQSGRTQPSFRDQRDAIIFGNRDSRESPDNSQRASESVRVDSQENADGREGQAGARTSIKDERNGQDGNLGKTQRNHQGHEERSQRNEGDELSEARRNSTESQRRNENEPRNIQQVHSADNGNVLPGKKHQETDLAGESETVRGTVSGNSRNDSRDGGDVPRRDPLNEISQALEKSIKKDQQQEKIMAEKEEAKLEEMQQSPKRINRDINLER